jgi:hypothetical protein
MSRSCASEGLENVLAGAMILRHTSASPILVKEESMATPERRYGGMTVGGIIVIVGIVLVVVWSFWIGLIVALIGLIGFGGFVRGKWY